MNDFVRGLAAAAKQLRATAADYDQMAAQMETQVKYPSCLQGAKVMREKAALLRGQAAIILEFAKPKST